ncbi:response regulator [Priestia taiwanensis]|uniref:Transcriptional regulatory protein n=1 Tax=Priestia taiwanensis TaxID=1347902 RepID=A0A917AMN2_9BACI|nr:response regulator [Priestia taiwanensis]MBM7362197.1 two-component system CitB family response regulator [Priestia taiwanensis]GGE60169.1 transcriptional regulatory protein [Priestia taiwanensis]
MEQVIKVLIVEDDLQIATIHKRFVERMEGFQVIGIATDRLDAEEQLHILQPDLLLLDVFFPDMNGLDFLQYIKEQDLHCDVIMITAAQELQTVSTALRKGVFDFIIKPVIYERFKQTLTNYYAFHQKVNAKYTNRLHLTQEDIDKLVTKTYRTENSLLPKGIDKLTLDKIIFTMTNYKNTFTAEQLGKEVGMSRTTARRYLEFLVSHGKIEAELSYGTVGRPERVYSLLTS